MNGTASQAIMVFVAILCGIAAGYYLRGPYIGVTPPSAKGVPVPGWPPLDRLGQVLGTFVTREQLIELIQGQKGWPFKASWIGGGAWDTYGSEGHAEPVAVNRGNGLEDAIAVETPAGIMLYIGPYRLEQEPSDQDMLLFYCAQAIFVGKPDGADPSEQDQ